MLGSLVKYRTTDSVRGPVEGGGTGAPTGRSDRQKAFYTES